MSSPNNSSSAEGPWGPFMKNLPGLAETYNDFTIVYGAEKFKAHKLILHAHSSWFAQWFEDNPDSNAIDLGDTGSIDEIERLLWFCYGRPYVEGEGSKRTAAHRDTIQIADKYICPGLKQKALYDLEDDLTSTSFPISFQGIVQRAKAIEDLYAESESEDQDLQELLKRVIKYRLGLLLRHVEELLSTL